MKISSLLNLLIVVLAILSISIQVISISQLNALKSDAARVNYTGIIRGASQRLVKLELANKKNNQLIEKIENIINALINGDINLKLKKTNDFNFLQEMNKVKEEYNKLKDLIDEYRSNKSEILKEKIINESEIFFDLTNKAVFSAQHLSENKLKTFKLEQFFLFIINIIILIFVYIFLKTKLSNRLEKIEKTIKQIAEGNNLFIKIQETGKDELAILSNNINIMLDKFKKVITTISKENSNLRDKIYNLQQELKESKEEIKKQVVASEQIAAATEQYSTTIADISENTKNTNEVSLIAIKKAQEGKETSIQSQDELEHLKTTTKQLADEMNDLINKVNQINKITIVIKEIADQTNLLSLNAAIEAARAGEHGKGFAVVADEIRKLAEKTISSTEEIESFIDQLKKSSQDSMEVTEKESKQVDRLSSSLDKLIESMQEIITSIEEINNSINFINTSINEQKSASENIAQSIEENAISTKHIEKTIENISNINNQVLDSLDKLQNSINDFREFNIAIHAHKNLAKNLHLASKGLLNLQKILSYKECSTGKLLESLKNSSKQDNLIIDTYNMHKAVHEKAQEILNLINNKAKDSIIKENLDKLDNLVENVISLLQQLKERFK